MFTLEGRPVPSLYLLAWLLTVGGIAALLFVAQAGPSAGGGLVAFVATVSLGLGLAAAAGYQLVARLDRHPDRYRGPSPLILFGLVLVVSALVSAGLAILGLVDIDRPVGFLIGLVAVAGTYLVRDLAVRGPRGCHGLDGHGMARRGTSMRHCC